MKETRINIIKRKILQRSVTRRDIASLNMIGVAFSLSWRFRYICKTSLLHETGLPTIFKKVFLVFWSSICHSDIVSSPVFASVKWHKQGFKLNLSHVETESETKVLDEEIGKYILLDQTVRNPSADASHVHTTKWSVYFTYSDFVATVLRMHII
jgi:hypothetical protein